MHGKAKDITGQTFGALTARAPTDARVGHFVVWECDCVCGQPARVSVHRLVHGGRFATRCPHVATDRVMVNGLRDFAGRTTGRLTAEHATDARDAHGYVLWQCACACGARPLVSTRHLAAEQKSCGRCRLWADGTYTHRAAQAPTRKVAVPDDALFAAYEACGRNLTETGKAVGLSTERVRQRVKAAGLRRVA